MSTNEFLPPRRFLNNRVREHKKSLHSKHLKGNKITQPMPLKESVQAKHTLAGDGERQRACKSKHPSYEEKRKIVCVLAITNTHTNKRGEMWWDREKKCVGICKQCLRN